MQVFKLLMIAAGFAMAHGALARASTIDFAGTVQGTASVDLAGRCAPSPTTNVNGTGFSDLLGGFADVQSDCMTSDSSIDDGIFYFTSLSNPADSLFGAYFAAASLQDGILDFTSILLINGGTGAFAGDFGAVFGVGTLDEGTGTFDETLSGQLETTVPEPGTMGLVVLPLVGLWLLSRKHRFGPA